MHVGHSNKCKDAKFQMSFGIKNIVLYGVPHRMYLYYKLVVMEYKSSFELAYNAGPYSIQFTGDDTEAYLIPNLS